MINGEKEWKFPPPADNSSSRVSSYNYFLLLQWTYSELDGVFFDDRYMDETFDDSVNFTFLLFEGLILK